MEIGYRRKGKFVLPLASMNRRYYREDQIGKNRLIRVVPVEVDEIPEVIELRRHCEGQRQRVDEVVKAAMADSWHPASEPPKPEDLPILVTYGTRSFLSVHNWKTFEGICGRITHWKTITPPTK